MKKLFLFLLMFIPASLYAENVFIDGLYYSLTKGANGNFATVVNHNGFLYKGDVVIPESVRYDDTTYIIDNIGYQAFSGCSEMTSVSIPNGVIKIGARAFLNCSGLTSIFIPNSVEEIGGQAFGGCNNLRSVQISDLSAWFNIIFDYVTNEYYDDGFDSNPLYYAHHIFMNEMEITDLVIPEGVTLIKDLAFVGCTGLKTVTIPGSVLTIGRRSFSFCRGLSSVAISDGVTNIEDRAFAGCSLTDVTLPSSVTTIGKESFYECRSLESVTISNGMTSIGDGAFQLCSSLTSVKIPNSVTSIGEWAFAECGKLSSVIIPNKITTISNNTFFCCGLTSVEIPNSVTAIGKEAFYYNSLETIIIPNSVKSIGDMSFADCYSLRKLYWHPEDVIGSETVFLNTDLSNVSLYVDDFLIDKFIKIWPGFKDYNGMNNIDFILSYYINGEIYKSYTYKYGDKIEKEDNPIKKGMVFSGWNEDVPETMPSSNIDITGSFSWSKANIDNVIYEVADTIADKAHVIGSENAAGEISITDSVVIDDYKWEVAAIADRAFYGCKDITKVEIPATVTSIGERAFANIDKLTDVTIWAEEPPTVDRTAFENSYTDDYVTLHVPYGSIGKYKEAAPWKNFKEIVAIEGTQRTYTIIYKVDGEVYKTVEVKEGEAITPEDAPTKEGYSFGGWTEIPETMPSSDLTVTGSFIANTYTITYYVDGEVYKTVEVAYGADIIPEDNPEKDGYNFSGWSWMPGKMPAEDVTVTGTFTKASYEIEGASYEINDDGMTLINADAVSGDVVLDATVTVNGNTYQVTAIGEGAFQDNDQITSLTIPEGVRTIGANAFNGCSALGKLILSRSISHVGSKAFANIAKSNARNRAASEPLTIVCYAESVPQAEDDCFAGTNVGAATLLVNDALVNAYKATTPWSYFGTIMGLDEFTGIGSVSADGQPAMIFSIDGRRIDGPQKGVNIIRTERGTRKVVIK